MLAGRGRRKALHVDEKAKRGSDRPPHVVRYLQGDRRGARRRHRPPRVPEAIRLDRYLSTVLLDWEFWYRDYADGILNEDELRYGGWSRLYYDVLPARVAEIWETMRANSDPAFVEFMEENVANR